MCPLKHLTRELSDEELEEVQVDISLMEDRFKLILLYPVKTWRWRYIMMHDAVHDQGQVSESSESVEVGAP